MIRGFYILCFLFSWVIFTAQAEAVSFSIASENNEVAIGTPLEVEMRIIFPSSFDSKEIAFPAVESNSAINDSVEFWNVNKATIAEENGKMIWSQNVEVVFWVGGNNFFGPLSFVLMSDTISSNVININVSSPEVDMSVGYKEIKGLKTDPLTLWEKIKLWFKNNWIYLLVIAGVIGLFFGLIKVLTKPKEDYKVKKEKAIPVPILLLERLNKTEEAQLWQNNKYKEYYSEITEVIRRFIEYKYNVPALEKTSSEIIASLKLSAIPRDELNEINNLFQLADMIKFAKSNALPEENVKAMTLTREMIKREAQNHE